MPNVDTRSLQELDRFLEKIANDMPEKRREFHEKVATIMQGEVISSINSSGVSTVNGTVASWQTKNVGSGGGYAVVRAKGRKEGAAIGNDGPGAKTNYVEEGHKIRRAGSSKNYRPRIKVSSVRAYHFYDAARTSSEAKVLIEAEKFTDEIAKELGG